MQHEIPLFKDDPNPLNSHSVFIRPSDYKLLICLWSVSSETGILTNAAAYTHMQKKKKKKKKKLYLNI